MSFRLVTREVQKFVLWQATMEGKKKVTWVTQCLKYLEVPSLSSMSVARLTAAKEAPAGPPNLQGVCALCRIRRPLTWICSQESCSGDTTFVDWSWSSASYAIGCGQPLAGFESSSKPLQWRVCWRLRLCSRWWGSDP
jgi:hypothetical protein